MIKTDYKFNVGYKENNIQILRKTTKQKKDNHCKKEFCEQKAYVLKCEKCNFEFEEFEYHLTKRGFKCPCCHKGGKRVINGFNSITDIPECNFMIPFFIGGENEAKLYKPTSSKKVLFECPICHERKKITVQHLYRCRGIKCKCSKQSIGETITENILIKNKIDYIKEYTPNWDEEVYRKRYDFYIPKLKMIIETHGKQHYEDCLFSTREYQQINDKLKYKKAFQYGIEKYIVIDTSSENINIIINNIKKSLSEYFDTDLVNADLIKPRTKTNLTIKEVCEYYNKTKYYPSKISEELKISKSTVIQYLKYGKELGYCDYDEVKTRRESAKKQALKMSKKTSMKIEVYLNDEFKGVYNSMSELDRKSLEDFGIRFVQSKISEAIIKDKNYKGYTFKRVND